METGTGTSEIGMQQKQYDWNEKNKRTTEGTGQTDQTEALSLKTFIDGKTDGIWKRRIKK